MENNVTSNHHERPSYGAPVEVAAAGVGTAGVLVGVAGGLLVDEVVVGLLVDVDEVDLLVVVVLRMERYVDVVVSGTRVVGATPTVMVADPRPCWPSMPITM